MLAKIGVVLLLTLIAYPASASSLDGLAGSIVLAFTAGALVLGVVSRLLSSLIVLTMNAITKRNVKSLWLTAIGATIFGGLIIYLEEFEALMHCITSFQTGYDEQRVYYYILILISMLGGGVVGYYFSRQTTVNTTNR
jgi:hypothetical protein